MSNVIDNRTEGVQGVLSQMNDLDECFRGLCGTYGLQIGKAKALTHIFSTKPVTAKVLIQLAMHLDCRIEIDPINDLFKIWHTPKGVKSVDIPESKPEEIEKPKVEEVVSDVIDKDVIINDDDDNDLF